MKIFVRKKSEMKRSELIKPVILILVILLLSYSNSMPLLAEPAETETPENTQTQTEFPPEPPPEPPPPDPPPSAKTEKSIEELEQELSAKISALNSLAQQASQPAPATLSGAAAAGATGADTADDLSAGGLAESPDRDPVTSATDWKPIAVIAAAGCLFLFGVYRLMKRIIWRCAKEDFIK